MHIGTLLHTLARVCICQPHTFVTRPHLSPTHICHLHTFITPTHICHPHTFVTHTHTHAHCILSLCSAGRAMRDRSQAFTMTSKLPGTVPSAPNKTYCTHIQIHHMYTYSKVYIHTYTYCISLHCVCIVQCTQLGHVSITVLQMSV